MQKSEDKSVSAILLKYIDVGAHDIHLLITVVEITGARPDHHVHRNMDLLLHHPQQTYLHRDTEVSTDRQTDRQCESQSDSV